MPGSHWLRVISRTSCPTVPAVQQLGAMGDMFRQGAPAKRPLPIVPEPFSPTGHEAVLATDAGEELQAVSEALMLGKCKRPKTVMGVAEGHHADGGEPHPLVVRCTELWNTDAKNDPLWRALTDAEPPEGLPELWSPDVEPLADHPEPLADADDGHTADPHVAKVCCTGSGMKDVEVAKAARAEADKAMENAVGVARAAAEALMAVQQSRTLLVPASPWPASTTH